MRSTLTIPKLPGLVAACVLAGCFLLFLPAVVLAQPAQPKRILVLYWYGRDWPTNSEFEKNFLNVVNSAGPPGSIEYYPEYLESNRFPGDDQEAVLRDYLKQKYANRHIDVVLAGSDTPLSFLLKYRKDLFPNTPIVFGVVQPPNPKEFERGAGLTGVINTFSFKQTLDLALNLHPDTRQVFIVSGTLAHDKLYETMAREKLQGYESKVSITYLTDLSSQELAEQTKHLPEHSLILYAWQQAYDDRNRLLETGNVFSIVASSAKVPIYGLASWQVGKGIVGGYVRNNAQNGIRMAEMAIQLANGARAQDVPVEVSTVIPMFDARELKRWGISEEQLPAGSIVDFKQLTFWEADKWYIIGAGSAIIVEGALIAFLLFTLRRVRAAERESTRLTGVAESAHRRLDETVSNVPGIVWESTIDPANKQRKTTFISDYVQRMLGYTAEEWLAWPTGFGATIVHEDDRERVLQASEDVLTNGRDGFSQFRWQAKDGRTVWAENYLSPIVDGAGEIIGLRGVAIDVSDRKLAEETAKQAEEKDRAILAAIPDLVFVQTLEGVYLDHHCKDPKDLLVPPEAFIGKNMREVLPPDLADKFAQHFQRAIETGEMQLLEYELPLQYENRWFEARIVASGENVFSVIRDITERKRAADALGASEGRLRRAQEAAKVGTWEWDIATGRAVWSEMIWKLLGLEPGASEATVDRFASFIHPEDRERVINKTRETLERGTDHDDEFRIITASGEELWLATKGRVIRSADGRAERMIGVNLDVTDRHRALEELRESQERFAKAFHSNPQPMSLTLLATGEYIDVNNSFLQVSGYRREEVIGKTSLELNIWGSPAVREAFIGKLKAKGSLVNEETKLRSKNGSMRVLLSSAEELEIYGKRCLLVASSDITERVLVQQALKESEERFRNMADTAPVMIWVADLNQNPTYFNQQWLDFTGRTMEQEIGLGWTSGIHPSDVDGCMKMFEAAFNSREPFRMEYRVRRHDGAYRWVIDSGTPRFSPDGEFLGYIGSGVDITDRKESEAALVFAHEALENAYGEVNQLKTQLQEENIYLQEEIKLEQNFGEIVGASDALKYVLFKIEQVAPTDSTVLITGDTGTGKELVARAIHKSSTRRDRPMVKVNCAALSASLIESELFGHERGAFTGAMTRKIGRFELADGGTIFLDEIGELPLELQVKLLRIIQEGEFERLGSSKTVKVDARIIAATNRNLKDQVNKGLFREDLWYRLNVFPITVPPLRQRREDIPMLIEHFTQTFGRKMGKEITSIAPATINALSNYSWPGNVRELANVIERAVINSHGRVLRVQEQLRPTNGDGFNRVDRTLEEVERDHIIHVLADRGWRIEGPNGAAHVLGMNPSTLRTRMAKLGIAKPSQLAAGSSGD